MIVSRFPPEGVGGAEYQAKKLAQHLSREGHRVTVFAGSKINASIAEGPNLHIVKVRYTDIRLLRIFLSPVMAFLPRIKKFSPRPEVLVCYQTVFAGVVGFCCKTLCKIPLVTWLRAESEYKSLLGKHCFTPLLLRSSDLFIVQSEGIKEQINRSWLYRLLFGRKRLAGIQVIPNGTDPVGVPAIPYRERKGILYVGRLHRVKGIEYLLQAIEGLEETLWVIGKGPDQDRLFRMSANTRVEFLGELPQEKLFEYMRKARLLVLPSLSEALPNVILEAMTAGLPVIATRVGGIPGIVIHGRTGFLVVPRNPGQIRHYVDILLGDQALGEVMSRACLQEVEKYSWPAVLKKFEGAILDVLHRRRRRIILSVAKRMDTE